MHNEADSSNECFNTQPPEGGCRLIVCPNRQNDSFNTQPPEGGCNRLRIWRKEIAVSTHSRPKAAGNCLFPDSRVCSFNTQPPEGGWAFCA